MRQVTRKGLMTMAAATGVLAAGAAGAHADSGATGAATGSPGVLSGNTVQAPVHAPVNVCGNTVNVVGVLNPSVGNSCANGGGASASDGPAGSAHHGGSGADARTGDSPGVGSGNQVQVPVHIPVNVCGNSVDVLGAGNATEGNGCANGDPGHGSPEKPGDPGDPGSPEQPENPGDEPDGPDEGAPPGSSDGNRPDAHSVTSHRADAQLAQTGSELPMGLALPAGAGALLAGAVLYRKARSAA
ncbi:chaplin [Streptomyces sp. CHD11]|uniref:chaplin n=1 Tax=Streptomyces sp. CHD11 TaxID=2741325 RepID=UPI001BFC68A7|nr:chaplin [Streptomyces sp. CHD11]MBT3151852.1 chaplin [Streptomyces sp. CHD11]